MPCDLTPLLVPPADDSDDSDSDGESAVVAADAKRSRGMNSATTKVGKKEKKIRITYASARSKEIEGPRDGGATAEVPDL